MIFTFDKLRKKHKSRKIPFSGWGMEEHKLGGRRGLALSYILIVLDHSDHFDESKRLDDCNKSSVGLGEYIPHI